MKKQNFELKNDHIRAAFSKLKQEHPGKLARRLNLSWSNWGFGMEPLAQSARRLHNAGIEYIELHGNHYGPDLGYQPEQTLRILGEAGVKVAGVCGMFSADNDLSSNRAVHRQAAIDYLRREIEFTRAVGGAYLLVVPGAVGRPQKYDDMEFDRSVETLRIVADLFVEKNVRAAIEPIRSAEVSFVPPVTGIACQSNPNGTATVTWTAPLPAVTVTAPESGSQLRAGSTVVLAGLATPGLPGAPVLAVTVNGRPVDALDAAGNFFALLPVASGVTALTVQATDAWGQTATADVTLIGVEPPAGEFAFDQAHDTTAAGRLTFEGTFFNRQTQTLHAGMRLTKTGDDLLECKNFGVTSLNEVKEKLTQYNLKLRGE